MRLRPETLNKSMKAVGLSVNTGISGFVFGIGQIRGFKFQIRMTNYFLDEPNEVRFCYGAYRKQLRLQPILRKLFN